MSGAIPAAASEKDAIAPAVELRGVTKRFDDVLALDGVSLTLAPGRFLTLLGPSGSGKSTLIRCLAGIERVSAGTIALGGSVVADAARQLPPERRDLAMVFQDFALWPHMTAAQNVAFALRRRKVRGAPATRQAVTMLERVGLAGLRGRYPHELSGGEQQRVALARALVASPDLLLFDEPLSSLDANLRERLRIEIGTLVRETGASAVYITHDQGEAFALGDDVGVLAAGRLVQHGPPEVIYRAPATPFVARFTGIAGALTGRVVGRAEAPAGRAEHPAGQAEDRAGQAEDRAGRAEDRGGAAGGPVRPAGGKQKLVRIAIETAAPGRFVELLASATGELAVGSAAQVLLRPSAVRLCRPDAAAAQLRGTIRDVAFRGHGYDYVVALGSGLELAGLLHRRQHARGDHVGVHIDPVGCFAYAADPTARDPAPLAEENLPPRARDAAATRARERSQLLHIAATED
ncbi:MAG: ABC transporter ATP-binding protein [Solirubrobacteraceae bacterium]